MRGIVKLQNSTNHNALQKRKLIKIVHFQKKLWQAAGW